MDLTRKISSINNELFKEDKVSLKNKILKIFENNPQKEFTQRDIDKLLFTKNSYKRISDLLREGLIYCCGNIKVDKKHYSLYKLTSVENIEGKKREQLQKDYEAWKKEGERFKEYENLFI